MLKKHDDKMFFVLYLPVISSKILRLSTMSGLYTWKHFERLEFILVFRDWRTESRYWQKCLANLTNFSFDDIENKIEFKLN